MTDRSPTDGLVSAVRSDEGTGVDSEATGSAADSASDGPPDTGALSERLAAVERAVGVRESDPTDAGGTDHEATDPVALRRRLDELEARVDELDAATQAVRGYVGSVRAVNEEVERRADLALAVAREAADNGVADNDLADSDVDDRSAEGTSPLPSDADIERALPEDPAASAAVPGDRNGRGDRHDGDRAGGDGRTDDGATVLDRLRESL